ncbi:hypothetical protein C943_03581 [Mariniradius saccharolyticus AK6]|uniref:Neutral/alkaline non-lysosomal ceramidase N-terminal domain-containing protein n=1 Tax=Mariniradius saccharolyticus AK6 TaxID=1239962 RepID=M7Y0X7_9BACT|nr:neutral/alkaline non-lysosomal ceramidase N-terminal domain-containing protein [Mariniradius saccharolyticus]EMS34362.1 hypothetical protein C943_03581 [Mariniradius saccharolyticus AK6]
MTTSSLPRRIFRVFAWIVGVLLVLALAFFTRVDRKDYHLEEYYLQTMGHLDTLNLHPTLGPTWLAGWSKVNTTPQTPAKLLGYRPRGRYDFVQDSSYIRSLIIGNGRQKIAFVNYELMIVHPYLQERILKRLDELHFPVDMVYFTATHTHSGLGGFIPGLMGKLALGSFDRNVVQLLEDRTLQSLQLALSSMDTVSMHFRKVATDNLVANRLIEGNPIDPYARQLILEKKNGAKGLMTTFSAHPTILHPKFMGLSGDYPHYFNERLENTSVDFSLFAAGTVGSMRPLSSGDQPTDVRAFADELAGQLAEKEGQVFLESSQRMKWAALPVQLRKAHFRLGKNVRVRPWIFNQLLGETNAHFDLVLLGNVLMISSSGEISGEMMEAWESFALENGLHLMITCFNGGYIGYITPDDYYDMELYETRDMNWFGPYNGAYFDEIIRKSISRMAQN